jgi:hypothetical protein
LRVCFVALLILGTLGCDGGDGDGTTTTTTTETDTEPASPITITVVQGTRSASIGNYALVEFHVYEPGVLNATASWSGAPASMMAGFVHGTGGVSVPGHDEGGSPLTPTADVTEALVSESDQWGLAIVNPGPSPVDVTYVITFTPD